MSLLRKFLAQTVEAGASDLHLKVSQFPYYRVNGQLVDCDQEPLTEAHLRSMVDDIVPSTMKPRFAEEHEVDFAYQVEGIGRFRTNIYQAQGAPCFTFRHVKTNIPNFTELHLPQIIEQLALSERGIILAAGTTGSGKSTTLAAMINHINQQRKKRIITIEDPLEYLFTDHQSLISQREIGIDTLDFSAALKHVLRQDPDVIMVGEMRDAESFSAALAAADTGHLVLSTVHADTASQAVGRILDFFPSHERDQMRISIAMNLRGIIGQRLMKGVQGGRYPAIEVMVNTPTVSKLIEKNRLDTLATAIEVGREDGMQNFNTSIYEQIKKGWVSEEEGMRHSSNPETLSMNLKGIFLSEDRRILDAD